MIAMGTTFLVKRRLRELQMADCNIEVNWDTGTATAKDGEVKVFAALQKGKGQPWICRYVSTERIKWGEQSL
jgi:hypothetical protein